MARITELPPQIQVDAEKLSTAWLKAPEVLESDLVFVLALSQLGEAVTSEILAIYRQVTGREAATIDEVLSYMRREGSKSELEYVFGPVPALVIEFADWADNLRS